MIQVERNYVNRSRGLSDASLPLVRKVLGVLEDLKDYLPLTLRQVYYRLVAAQIIDNDIKAYKKLSMLLTKARLNGYVPWGAIEDRARATLTSAGWDNSHQFIDDETENFLEDYRRHLIQDQTIDVQVWVEKDALSRVCHRAAYKYCVPVIVAKGFSSISYMHQCAQRIEASADEGKPTTILYLGDFDPSGWEMPEAMLETFHGDMGIDEEDLTIYRCALNEDQVQDMGLPHSPEALKAKDSRARKFVDRFGTVAVELDAIPPADLERLVAESIQEVLDMKKIRKQIKLWEQEVSTIEDLKGEVEDKIMDWKEEHGID